MRRFNAILSMMILLLFLVHGIVGAFQLIGLMPGGSTVLRVLSWVMTGLILVHAVIGIKFMIEALLTAKKTKAPYLKENLLFWTKSVSGLAIMLFLLSHILIFVGRQNGVFRLNYFGGFQLATQILLVLSIATHVIANVKPLMISFGIKSLKPYAKDILFVLSVVLFLAGVSFVIYYLRWNVF